MIRVLYLIALHGANKMRITLVINGTQLTRLLEIVFKYYNIDTYCNIAKTLMKRLKPPSAEVILIVGIILILTAPWIVSLRSGIVSFNDSTSVIGDTIGGITAPITGLIGAYLVYLALKEQVKANRIITSQFKEQKIIEQSNKIIAIVTDQIKILREDMKDFKFNEILLGYDELPHFGPEGIKRALKVYPEAHPIIDESIIWQYNSKINEIKYFVSSVHYLINLINTSVIDIDDKINLLKIISETYNSKLSAGLIDNNFKRKSYQTPCVKCAEIHGIDESIFVLNDFIVQELDFLKLNDK
jgi:hypothetical protein